MPFKSQFPDVELPDKSLSDCIFDKINNLGDAIAVVDNSLGGKSSTFEQIYKQSKNVAGFLNKIGVQKGDVVGLCGPTCLEFPIAMFGILASGAVVTPCNPAYSEGEILQQFRISRPRMVIVHEDCVDTMKKVDQQIDCLEKIFVIGESKNFTTFDEMIDNVNIKDFPTDLQIDDKEDLALLPYSSGTTGLPKSVMLTHRNLTSALTIFLSMETFSRPACVYMDRPMYHAGGFLSVLLSLACGTKLIIEKEFDVEIMLQAIQKYKVTQILTVPPILIQLVNDDRVANYDVSAVREILCGGAALSPDVLRKIGNKFGAIMRPAYGMTECSGITFHSGENSLYEGVGKISPNMEVKIIDLHSGAELSENENGEILVRGPEVTKGYFKNPEATAQTKTKDGWLHTGDIGYIDKNGIMYIIDRLKEVIKYKSVQVPPAELENVLLCHPKVADVGVIGIPDTYAGELPKAFIVKKDDSLTGDEVDAFVKEQLVDYKQLRGGIEFVDKIPKSATGKIQRNELKKMAGIIS